MNWLIKLFGGYTDDDYIKVIIERDMYRHKCYALKLRLEKALKNDTPRDPRTGRFVKKCM